jgi:hypothetical protein
MGMIQIIIVNLKMGTTKERPITKCKNDVIQNVKEKDGNFHI